MPYRREQLVNGEIYHVVIRGIDNNLLFKDIDDYYRGIFSIYEFNNSNPVGIFRRRKEIQLNKELFKEKIKQNPSLSGALVTTDERDLMVEVVAFCLMPNHVHLLLKQLEDGGITEFMRKMGTGYAKYFNQKYSRKGHLFQGRFVSVRIRTNEQLKIVFVYIHANPISLIEPKWKEKGIKNSKKVIEFLENKYRWSSYFDYIGKKNFPSVTEREFMSNVMGETLGCKQSVQDWVRIKGGETEFPDLALES